MAVLKYSSGVHRTKASLYRPDTTGSAAIFEIERFTDIFRHEDVLIVSDVYHKTPTNGVWYLHSAEGEM